MRDFPAQTSYNPDASPRADEWLGLDESDRLELVEAYHRRKRIRLPNQRLHAVFHVIIENQLAMGEEVVVDTVTRLRVEGLSRHDAIRAQHAKLPQRRPGSADAVAARSRDERAGEHGC